MKSWTPHTKVSHHETSTLHAPGNQTSVTRAEISPRSTMHASGGCRYPSRRSILSHGLGPHETADLECLSDATLVPGQHSVHWLLGLRCECCEATYLWCAERSALPLLLRNYHPRGVPI